MCAEIMWRCQCAGQAVILSESEINKVINKFENYGQAAAEKKGDQFEHHPYYWIFQNIGGAFFVF